MLPSLALDALLVLIILLLIPLGMYRGGQREVCSAAGLMLGYLIADAWAVRWGDWVAETSGINSGVSRFVVAVLVLVIVTGTVGYGAAAAFSHRPGPGGRLFGGLIALFSGVFLIGAMIEFVRRHLHDGEIPILVREGYVSRALATGFDWVLLLVVFGALVATLFGMLVRERDTDDVMMEIPHDPPVRRAAPLPVQAPEPVGIEPSATSATGDLRSEPTAAVRIREVRHWEEPTTPNRADLATGWSQTWPAVDREPTSRGSGAPGRRKSTNLSGQPAASSSSDEDVLSNWLEREQRSAPDSPDRNPQSDE